MTTKSNEPYGLYIHVPFCIKKCNYCDFYSLPYSEDLALEYGIALISELDLIGNKYDIPQIDTVYIGGGTPSLLPKQVLGQICDAVNKNFSFANKEFTLEVNPATNVDFPFYKSLGINRISMGVQSLDDKILKVIGRLHKAKTAIATLESAAKVFDNVSADLMLGLPFSTIDGITSDIKTIAPLVKHISAYILTLSPGVPLSKSISLGKVSIPDDDLSADMYDAALQTLEEQGIFRYEISNFARIGYESLHNLKYWHRVGYFAAGPAAHSFVNGIRYANDSDLSAYLRGENIQNGHGTTTEITTESALFEEIMLALRLPNGINIANINAKYNIDFLSKYKTQIKTLAPLITFDGENLFINKDKFLLESAVAREFL